jgi:hypothetical protein
MADQVRTPRAQRFRTPDFGPLFPITPNRARRVPKARIVPHLRHILCRTVTAAQYYGT